jgi:hypothetical protein
MNKGLDLPEASIKLNKIMREVIFNDNGNQEVKFYATLIAELPTQSRSNSNGTNYKIANIQFADADGELQDGTAMIYEGNYRHGLEVGKSYLTTAEFDGESVYLRMSHLEPRIKAEPSMFGFQTESNDEVISLGKPKSKSRQVITEDELADF